MRRIIRIDEHGSVRMEGNPQEEVWMTLMEIADLFNLPAATIGREIRRIRKTGVLVDYEVCKYIRMAGGCSVDIYHWDIIVALSYRINTFYAHAFRKWLKETATRKRKERHNKPSSFPFGLSAITERPDRHNKTKRRTDHPIQQGCPSVFFRPYT
ncbi:hypothetical protein NXY40_09905 [Phocaeicola vulgatus]|nr:hypothetical protein [Phocaeicola vulgatus]